METLVTILFILLVIAVIIIGMLYKKCEHYWWLYDHECMRNELREHEISQKVDKIISDVRAEYESKTPRII